jgi:hypothetical protein
VAAQLVVSRVVLSSIELVTSSYDSNSYGPDLIFLPRDLRREEL